MARQINMICVPQLMGVQGPLAAQIETSLLSSGSGGVLRAQAYDQAPTGVDAGVCDDRPALVQSYGVPDGRGLVEDLTGQQNHPLP